MLYTVISVFSAEKGKNSYETLGEKGKNPNKGIAVTWLISVDRELKTESN